MALHHTFPSYTDHGAQSWGNLSSTASDSFAGDRGTLTRAHLRKGLVMLVDDGRWRSAQVMIEQYAAGLVGWKLWLPRELIAVGLAAGLRCETLPEEKSGSFIEGLARAGEVGVILDLRLQSSESKVAWAQTWPAIREAACVHVHDLAAGAKLLLHLNDRQAADSSRYAQKSATKLVGSSWMQSVRGCFARA